MKSQLQLESSTTNTDQFTHQSIQLIIQNSNSRSEISVDPLDTPSCLVFDSPSAFICNGKVLSPALSFAFQSIQSGDIIYVIPRQEKERDQPTIEARTVQPPFSTNFQKRLEQRIKEKFRDSDNIIDELNLRMNPSTANEFARVSDLRILRCEQVCQNVSKRRFLSLFTKEQKLTNIANRIRVSRMNTIVPENPSSPSSTMLPEPWLKSVSLKCPFTNPTGLV